jgi:tetratricopeptide (TPR) repeat protein
MQHHVGSVRVARLHEIAPIAVAGGLFHPVRRTLGVRAFGINAYTARAAGDQLIEEHDETGVGSGRQEELYFVVAGRARFTVDGEGVDAPAGTLVFVPDVSARRSAVAVEADTTALVVGGPAERPLPVSPFEYYFAAEAPYAAGDYARAIEIASEGLEQWPDHPVIHYQLACYHALASNRDDALDHLERAVATDPRMKELARTDRDFDAVRDEPRFSHTVA